MQSPPIPPQPWLVQNKELIAALGVLLGLVPRVLDITVQAGAQRKRTKALEAERQRLELTKLRHEIEKLRRDLGEPQETVPALTSSGPELGRPPSDAHPPESALPPGAPVVYIPNWVQWLRTHPSFGAPLLWILQAALWLAFASSALVTVILPITLLGNDTNRGELGWTGSLLVEVVYILMTWAFLVLYRKARSWRTTPLLAV